MWILRVIYLFGLFFFITRSSFAHYDGNLHIVVLHSYNQENAWTVRISSGFKDNIEKQEYKNVNFYTEYIDSKRFYGDNFDKSLKKLYFQKYKRMHVDLVATTDDYALDFALKYRNEIFDNAPVIFSGINGFDRKKRELYKKEKSFTGILSILDVKNNVELASKLQPDAKKIYIINTKYTPSGRYFKSQFLKGFAPYESKFKIKYLEDLSFEELYEKARNFEKDSIVFFGGYSRDRYNVHMRIEDVLKEVGKFSTRPVYGFTDFYVNYGLTGGFVVSGYEQGKSMAKMANDYLKGKKVQDIPIITNPRNPVILNLDNLKRHNINLDNIPKDARLIFKKSKLLLFYDTYKREFWGVIISFLILFFSSIGLYYFSVKQKELKDKLIRLNNILEDKVEERTRQLIDQQSKLVNSARLATMGELASGIAHEINNPLAIIDLNAGRVKQRTKNESNFKQIDRINSTVVRISKIIKGLKHLSKDGESTPMEEFFLVEAIEDVSSICREKFREYDITVTVDISRDLKVYGSLVQVGQMLLNILNNSFDELVSFKGERWVNLKAERVFIKDMKSYVEVSITDSGNGVKPEDQSKLMDPFFTTKADKRGAGLGLTVCHNIITSYGGEFFYDSDSKNTRFVIRLPDKEVQQAVS